ncbi:MAG: DUF4350 domain-containing protein [Bacteroidetes bacterium]|nr:DUF4350 domain-containing protein [Bacteroidota bacterium]
MKTLLSFALAAMLLHVAGTDGMLAQQRGDDRFVPVIKEKAFPADDGPIIVIDEAHNNYHTMNGRYRPFAEFLRAHGCTVLPGTQACSAPTLAAGDIYVIANALAERNIDDWSLPVDNAFNTEEIDAIARWVHEGGSLFLIADHMPFPKAIDSLAIRFSIRFSNGFALYAGKPGRGLMFTRSNDNLREHWITDTPFDGARVDSVVTFTGSAFQIQRAHDPLLVFGAGMLSLEPKVAWEFDEKTNRVRVEGWRQGAALEYGKGRIVVFGEAAMFTAQKAENGLPVGLNTPEGAHNAPLLVNIIRWLASREGRAAEGH